MKAQGKPWLTHNFFFHVIFISEGLIIAIFCVALCNL